MKKTSPKNKTITLGRKIKFLFISEKKEIKLLGVIGLAGLVAIITLVFSSSTSSFLKEKIVNQKNETEQDCEFRSTLTGVCVETALAQMPVLAAVMIENHPESRPQAGLAEADVVYEAMVEGNYTRFLALYPHDARVVKVGPVRSARPYYLDWLGEYGNSLYLHVGGSPDALKLISARKMWDANEMHGGNYFWRANNRFAPHNTYTNTELWNKKIGDDTKNEFVGWAFTTSSVPCLSQCVDFIEIPYLRPSFVTGWKFNSSTHNYERWQDGTPHHTETGNIYADTVVLMQVPVKVLDEVGRLEMKTIGTGPAMVIVNGKKIVGVWQKKSVGERTVFKDERGEEIGLKPGKIWIQVVPRLEAVNFTVL